MVFSLVLGIELHAVRDLEGVSNGRGLLILHQHSGEELESVVGHSFGVFAALLVNKWMNNGSLEDQWLVLVMVKQLFASLIEWSRRSNKLHRGE